MIRGFLRLVSILFSFFAVAALVIFCSVANAETISTFQDIGTTGPYGTKINNLALTAIRWTGWIKADTKRTVCYDIDWTDADSSCLDVYMWCSTARSTTTNEWGGYAIPVFVSTASTGITKSTAMSISQVGGGGGAPGTSNWTWCVTNIPGPFIGCHFSTLGVAGPDDKISVFARGITP